MASLPDSHSNRGQAEPLWHTPRNPNRETIGPDIVRVLANCGPRYMEPMPWQKELAAVAGEIDPTTGLLWYRNVIVIGLRQIGKTTFTRGKLTHRALTMPGARLLYTAQDRNMARRRLEKTIWQPLSLSALGKTLAPPRWSNGSEAVRWRNGSEINIISNSPTAGHGDTLDEAHIDEAFAHRDSKIEQNVSPTMITVQGSQKWISSAAGDLNSTFLAGKRDMGRELVRMGGDSRTLYVEYAAPQGADPDDPFTYLKCHPAIGFTITLEDVLDERRNMDFDEFARAYLGWWPAPVADQPPIPLEAWEACFIDEYADTWQGTPMWSVDVSPDRTWSSIGLAAQSFVPGTRAFIEVIDHEMGTAWCVDRLKGLAQRFGGWRVTLDGSGSSSSLIEDLENCLGPGKGFEVVKLTARERADACGGLHDDVMQGKVRFLDDPVFNKAMKSARKIGAYGGESWIFSRGKSMADITPLYAGTLARYGHVKYSPLEYDVLDTIA